MSTEHYQNLHLLNPTLQRKLKKTIAEKLISVKKKLGHKTFLTE